MYWQLVVFTPTDGSGAGVVGGGPIQAWKLGKFGCNWHLMETPLPCLGVIRSSRPSQLLTLQVESLEDRVPFAQTTHVAALVSARQTDSGMMPRPPPPLPSVTTASCWC